MPVTFTNHYPTVNHQVRQGRSSSDHLTASSFTASSFVSSEKGRQKSSSKNPKISILVKRNLAQVCHPSQLVAPEFSQAFPHRIIVVVPITVIRGVIQNSRSADPSRITSSRRCRHFQNHPSVKIGGSRSLLSFSSPSAPHPHRTQRTNHSPRQQSRVAAAGWD